MIDLYERKTETNEMNEIKTGSGIELKPAIGATVVDPYITSELDKDYIAT